MSHFIKSQIVQAGAGTGKTTRLKDEVFRTLQSFKAKRDRYPRLIICTFTRKATQELKRRLFEKASLSQEEGLISHISSPSLFISTIHGILSLFLKQHGQYDFGLSTPSSTAEEKERRIADQTAEELLFGNHFPLLEEILFPVLRSALMFYAKHKLIDPRLRLFSEKELKGIEEKDQKLCSDRTPARGGEPDFAGFIEERRKEDPLCFEAEAFGRIFSDFELLAQEFSKKFRERKKRDGVMTMEDIELLSLDLLNRKPETGRHFAADWDHWFIDEYQDTSRAQEQIIQKITGFKNVFCVGDPKQSIYLFRGADPEVFNRRVRECLEPAQTLKTNYRSQSGLIYFFNDFFPEEKGFLPLNPPEKTDTEKGDAPLPGPDTFPKSKNKSKVTPDGKSARTGDSVQGGRTKAPSQNAGKKPSVFFIYYDGDRTFFEAVHAQIQKFLNQGSAPGSIAVLGRKNEPLSRLARFLKTKNIPVRLSSRRGLSRQRLILDALFFLKFLINPHDDENFLSLCRTPYFRVSDEELVRWCQSRKEESGSLSLWSFVQEHAPSCETAQTLKIYSDLKREKGIYHTFERGLFERGFMDLTQFQDPSGLVEAYLWNLLTKVHSARKAMEHPLTLFYSLMEEEEGADSFQEETGLKEDLGFVRLMTIHSAKGLQFKNVIVFDLSKNIRFQASREECIFDPEQGRMAFSVPLNGRDQKKIRCYGQQRLAEKKESQEMRETDRLLYVALTRAEETVTLMVPFKPPTHSWFKRFEFFRRLQDPLQGKSGEKKKKSTEEGKGSGKKEPARPESFRHSETKTEGQNRPDKSPGCEKTVDDNDDNLPVRTGLHYVRDKYCFSVECNPIAEASSRVKFSPKPLLRPLPDKPAVPLLRKTAGDFVKDMSENGEKRLDETPPTKENGKGGGPSPESQGNKLPLDSNTPRTQTLVPSHRTNIFLKTELGRFLHDCLKLLSFHPLDTLENKISNSGFSEKERERLKSALRWTAGLKDPDIPFFLKTGFAEQPFQLKESSLILHGRIDLWGRKDGIIHVFDYKSASVPSPAVWNQLAFYSYALEKIHRPERIIMCAIYPLAQKVERRLYSGEHRDRMAFWISRQTEPSRSDPKILL